MDIRKKAVDSMMGEPILKIVMKPKAVREAEEGDEQGMITMKVTPEEKEMILAQRAQSEGAESEEESNPFKKKASLDDA